MSNPFELIDARLESIESLLLGLNLKDKGQPSSNLPPDAWLNIDSLINYLPEKPAKATIYAWVHANSIPYYKNGKHLRFRMSEIDEWIQSGKKKTAIQIAGENDAYLSNRKKAASI